VKDFMREYGKLAAVTAAGAFLISLVVGLASGNPFGVALGRALLFALLFAGLAAGARYIVTKYLPELAGTTPPESASGQKIDITLPEEGPVPLRRAGAYAPASGQPVHAVQSEPDLATEEVGASGGADETPAPDLERPGGGEMPDLTGDSFDDELPPLTDDEAIAENEGLAPDSVEEAESVPEDGSTSRAEETDDPFQVDAELGRLPDISSLGGSVSGTRTSPPPRAAQTPEDAMKGALGSRDPATLARAIRTVLKREEKG
jgi:hypothetical protein